MRDKALIALCFLLSLSVHSAVTKREANHASRMIVSQDPVPRPARKMDSTVKAKLVYRIPKGERLPVRAVIRNASYSSSGCLEENAEAGCTSTIREEYTDRLIFSFETVGERIPVEFDVEMAQRIEIVGERIVETQTVCINGLCREYESVTIEIIENLPEFEIISDQTGEILAHEVVDFTTLAVVDFNLKKKADVRCALTSGSLRDVTQQHDNVDRWEAVNAAFRTIQIGDRRTIMNNSNVLRVTFSDGGVEDWLIVNPYFSDAAPGARISVIEPGDGVVKPTVCRKG